MQRSFPRALKRLCAVGAIGAVALGTAATSAFAAPAGKVTADQIVKKANADLRSVSSVELWSRASANGVTITITEKITVRGCLATISSGGGLSENLLIIGSTQLIQPSNGLWQALGYTGTELSYLEGKWVTAAAFFNALGLGGSGGTGGTCNTRVPTGIPLTGWTLGKSARISGHWSWRLINKKQAMSAYVSDTRKPEFLRLTERGVTEYFSHYNAPLKLELPPASDVVTKLPPPPNAPNPARADLGVRTGLLARAGIVARAGLAHAGFLASIPR